MIYKAKNDYRQEFVEELEREEAKGNLFGVVKRMASRNKDLVGGGSVNISRTRRARYRWRTQGCWRFGESIMRHC